MPEPLVWSPHLTAVAVHLCLSFNVFAGVMADEVIYTLMKQPSTSAVSQRCHEVEPQMLGSVMLAHGIGVSRSIGLTTMKKKKMISEKPSKTTVTIGSTVEREERMVLATGRDLFNLKRKPDYAQLRLNSPLGVPTWRSVEVLLKKQQLTVKKRETLSKEIGRASCKERV